MEIKQKDGLQLINRVPEYFTPDPHYERQGKKKNMMSISQMEVFMPIRKVSLLFQTNTSLSFIQPLPPRSRSSFSPFPLPETRETLFNRAHHDANAISVFYLFFLNDGSIISSLHV